MKGSICLFVLALISATSFAERNDLEKYGLKGKVRSVKEVHTMDHRVQGRMVQTVTIISYTYNEAGYLTERSTVADRSKMPDRVMIDTFSLDVTRIPLEKIEMRTRYNYDAQGRLMSEEEFISPSPDRPVKVAEYSYDVQDRRVMTLYYDPREEYGAKEITRMSYDAQGRLQEKSVSIADANTAFEEKEKEQYVYDEKGNVIEKKFYDREKKIYWKEFSAIYNEQGLAIEDKMYTPEGEVWQTKKVKRDADGNITELVTLQYDGREYVEKYKYANNDAKGNYTKKVSLGTGRTMYGDNPVTTVERVIEYYQ